MDRQELFNIIKLLDQCGIPAELDVPLVKYTTFRLGGRCSCLVECQKPEQVIQVIQIMLEQGIPFFLIGGGSNLLVSDKGIESVVVCFKTDQPSIVRDGETLTVSGGVSLDALAKYAVENDIEGFVNCSGIPGTVGGAVAGNAGAFGWQIGDALISASIITLQGNVNQVSRREIGFHYRHSGLKESGSVVLEAVFNVDYTKSGDLCTERARILKLRASKHPDLREYSCAGSFFKNIEPTSAAERRQAAGWFLEQAGVKAMTSGGAGIYKKHANIIVQVSKDCCAQDVLDLSNLMAEAVRDKFGITLEREVRLVGNFRN